MQALITGAAGFIGSNLVKRCLDEGIDVWGVDDFSNGHKEFLPKGFHLSSRFLEADFADEGVLHEIRNKSFDVVIHLAAVPRVSYSVEHPLETNDVNVSRTLKLADACRGNVKRFVFASSSSVYGGADVLPTAEFAPKDPKSPYALQKSIVEEYLKLYDGLYGLESVCLRFFNVFGPNQLGDSPYATAVSAWLTAIKKGQPMRSDGDGLQSRDMCYVDNVTSACVKAAQFPGRIVGGMPFNVACGDRTTNLDILHALKKRYPGATYVNAPVRPGDVKHTLADVTRIQDILGYRPLVKFWEGFDRTCDWYDAEWDVIKDMRLKT
jgi:UDP-N-acetylglucosamine/UDP-N-acetyl-alpha-D-glucosaminouronate 4-epimerase